MIDTSKLCKTFYGSQIAIGGSPNNIVGLYYSLWNFGALSGELLDLGNANNFRYFIVSEDQYILARTKNKVIHWPYNGYKGRPGNIPFGLAKLVAQIELQSIKEENFLQYNYSRPYLYKSFQNNH
jgi:hypothetical protein